MARTNISTGSKWEPIIGYSRAVRMGNSIQVSGTTGSDAAGNLVGAGDVYAQATQAILNIKSALEQAGASLEDVVRTRMFVTDISQWEEVGRAHGDFFGTIRPATTIVEVSRLIDPNMLIEIEADALINEDK